MTQVTRDLSISLCEDKGEHVITMGSLTVYVPARKLAAARRQGTSRPGMPHSPVAKQASEGHSGRLNNDSLSCTWGEAPAFPGGAPYSAATVPGAGTHRRGTAPERWTFLPRGGSGPTSHRTPMRPLRTRGTSQGWSRPAAAGAGPRWGGPASSTRALNTHPGSTAARSRLPTESLHISSGARWG